MLAGEGALGLMGGVQHRERVLCSRAPLFLCVPFSCSSLHLEIFSILQSCSPPKERRAAMSYFSVEENRQEIYFRIA